MQHLVDFHPFLTHPEVHPILVACGDVVAWSGSVDAASHMWKFGDECRQAFDLGQHGIGGGGIQRAEIVVLGCQAGQRASGPERISHAGAKRAATASRSAATKGSPSIRRRWARSSSVKSGAPAWVAMKPSTISARTARAGASRLASARAISVCSLSSIAEQ